VARGRERDRVTQPVGAASYYGRPILKEPTWTWEVPVYFFTGGTAGAAALLAGAARLARNDELARRATLVNFAAIAVSPPLLISDLGRPERFVNMLRVFKPTSPMSVGSWVVAGAGTVTGVAGTCELLGILPRVRAAGQAAAAVLGPALSTYTAVLVSGTSIPVWHEARRQLPFVFAGSAAASGGGIVAALTPPVSAGPARRLAVVGAVVELAATEVMERRLGFLAEPYYEGRARPFSKLAKGLTAAGATVTAVGGRRRAGAVLGGLLLAAGSLSMRLAVYRAGFDSARDPRYVVQPQRSRLRERGYGPMRSAAE